MSIWGGDCNCLNPVETTSSPQLEYLDLGQSSGMTTAPLPSNVSSTCILTLVTMSSSLDKGIKEVFWDLIDANILFLNSKLALKPWNQSEVLGHECISILSEPNIWWMEHSLDHCAACLSELNMSWIIFLGRTRESCKNMRSFILLWVSDCFYWAHPQLRVGCFTFLP